MKKNKDYLKQYQEAIWSELKTPKPSLVFKDLKHYSRKKKHKKEIENGDY